MVVVEGGGARLASCVAFIPAFLNKVGLAPCAALMAVNMVWARPESVSS